MKISIVNLLDCTKNVYKCFYLTPAICWQKDKDYTGIWLCWLNIGIYWRINNE